VKHGHTIGPKGATKKTRVYIAWSDMRQRCLNPHHKNFDRYGGRGIRICDRWNEFANFLADMGEPPVGMWLDRENNDGHYEPSNCRWQTATEQQQNRSDNHLITWQGETLCVHEWGRRTGLGNTLSHRLRRGWPVQRALTEGLNR
jgi:hypothetical protein